MLKINNRDLIVGMVALTIGMYSSVFFFDLTSFTLSREVAIEINPFDIVTSLITISLAIYVAKVIGKQNDLERETKKILLQSLSNYQSLMHNKVYRILEQPHLNTPEANSDLKILRKRIAGILKLCKEYKYLDNNCEASTQLQDKVKELWETITECPKRGETQSEKLKIKLINEIEAGLIEIEELIIKISMMINQK